MLVLFIDKKSVEKQEESENNSKECRKLNSNYKESMHAFVAPIEQP